MLRQQRILWLAILLLIAPALACNAFAGSAEPPLPPPPTLVGTVTVPPAATVGGVVPTVTLPADETPDGRPQVITLVDLNVRNGPGVQYDRVGFILEGEASLILGRDPNTNWWKIECPSDVESNECWVSGGAQYTTAQNSDGVPVAAVPPTPTSVPPSLGPNQALVTYVENGRLLATTVDLSQDPPAALETAVLFAADAGSVIEAYIAPDGRKIAFLWGGRVANNLSVINIDGSGQQDLISTTDLPTADSTANVGLRFGQINWLADSQTLIFNTNLADPVGPVIAYQNDLWTVSLDGILTEQQAAGSAGAFFTAAGQQILFSQAETIGRSSLEESQVNDLIKFDLINTGSEYTYFPQPQWTANGNQAYVAIPNKEPFGNNPSTTLWRIPTSGNAERLTDLPDNTLFNPVTWSANGNVLAYVREDIPNNEATLVIANGNGADATDYATSPMLTFHSWRPNEREFIYSGNNFWAIGQIGTQPIQSTLPAGTRILDAQWLTEGAFVLALQTGSGWQLYGSNPTGNSNLLIDISNNIVTDLDVWGP